MAKTHVFFFATDHALLVLTFVALLRLLVRHVTLIKVPPAVRAKTAVAPLFLFIALFLPLLVGMLTVNAVGSISRWTPLVALIFACLITQISSHSVLSRAFISSRSWLTIYFFAMGGVAAVCTMVSYIQIKRLSTSTDSMGMPRALSMVVVIFVFFVLGIIWSSRKTCVIDYNQFFLLCPVIFLSITSLTSSPWGQALLNIYDESRVLLSSLIFVVSSVGWELTMSRNSEDYSLGVGKQKRRYILILLLTFGLFCSARIDSLESEPASFFHVGFFSGPIQTIRSGGTLLWDTPTQYGYLNTLIPAWFPFADSRLSFIWFQAVLLFVVFGVVLVTLSNRFKTNKSFLIASLLFLVSLFLPSPSLAGSQTFPSASVVRFGPSLLLIVWFASDRFMHRFDRRIQIVTTAALVTTSVFWSGESMVYTSFILVGWGIAGLSCVGRGEKVKFVTETIAPYLRKILLFIAVFFSFVSIKMLIFNGHFPEWSLLFMAPIRYAQAGFGAVALKIATPAWLFVFLIGLISTNLFEHDETTNRDNVMENAALGAVAGGLVGWGTYFVGRAVPENIIAMYPLYTFSSLIAISLIVNQRRHWSGFSHQSEITRGWINQSVALFAVCSLSVVTVAVLGQAGLVQKISQIRFLPNGIHYASDNYVSQDLANTLTLTQAELQKENVQKGISIAYNGWNGMLLKLPSRLSNFYNPDFSWLPVPLALLEEPIPKARRNQLVQRYVSEIKRDGVIVLEKSATDRLRDFGEWLDALDESYKCRLIVDNVNYRTMYCRYRF